MSYQKRLTFPTNTRGSLYPEDIREVGNQTNEATNLLNDTRVACVGSRNITGQNIKLDGLVLHLAELEGDAAIVTSSVDGEEIGAARETGATQAAASCRGSGANL